jgi:hypothetical protein
MLGPLGPDDVLMEPPSAHEPPGDVGGLQRGALGRRMGGEVAGYGNEDMPALVAVAPLPELVHAGLQRLIGMEARIFPQQRPRQHGDQRLRLVTKRGVARHQTRREIDLSLPVEVVEQSSPIWPISALVSRVQ